MAPTVRRLDRTAARSIFPMASFSVDRSSCLAIIYSPEIKPVNEKMTSGSKKKPRRTSGRRIERIRRQIDAMTLVAQGTLSKRTKVCGRPNCRCAQDPDARHGPYYEWTRREGGRFLHSIVQPDQAEQLAEAIDNYKRILGLLAAWSSETARILKIRNGTK